MSRIDRFRRNALGAPAVLALVLLLGACTTADAVKDASVAPRVSYYESGNGQTSRTEATFTGAGGRTLGYVHHRPVSNRTPSTALVYLHGIESHAGWFDAPADMLCARGYELFCLDRRGSGINRENRGFVSGHVDSEQTLFEDIHVFMADLRERFDAVYLVGLSWGGKLALAHALTHPEDCDGVILITPGLRSFLDKGVFEKMGILMASVMNPEAQFDIPIEPEMFTRTERFLELIRRDPLRLHTASGRFFMISNDLDGYVDERMPANRLPLLLFLAGRDQIIDNPGVLDVLSQGGQEVFDAIEYEDQTHSIQFDAPGILTDDIDAWIKARDPR